MQALYSPTKILPYIYVELQGAHSDGSRRALHHNNSNGRCATYTQKKRTLILYVTCPAVFPLLPTFNPQLLPQSILGMTGFPKGRRVRQLRGYGHGHLSGTLPTPNLSVPHASWFCNPWNMLSTSIRHKLRHALPLAVGRQ